MRILGIDLAAQPENTGACVVEWLPDRAVAAPAPVEDDALVEFARDVDLVAVDAPLGWPDAFVAAVHAHHSGVPWPAGPDSVELRMRLTDQVLAATRFYPLSVSSDRIAVAAFRAARLAGRLAEGQPRDGSGRLVELYPAVALYTWGLPYRRYKGTTGTELRGALVGRLCAAAPWLDVDAAALCRRDHDLDALVCALVGRAAATGRTARPAEDQRDRARREGWIHVPTAGLDVLGP